MYNHIIKAILFVGLVFISSDCFSQSTPETAIKDINRIKSSKNYLYAESTTKTWDEAYENARVLLSQLIEDWIKQKDKNVDVAGYVAKCDNKILEIQARRGSLYRAFVYVKKSDIMIYSDRDDIIGQTLEVKTNEIIDTIPSILKDPVIENPQVPNEPEYNLNANENKLLQLKDANMIQSFLKENASNFFKVTELPSDKDSYVIVFNKDIIYQYLLHHSNGMYINLKTCKKDSIENYKSKGLNALGFIFK